MSDKDGKVRIPLAAPVPRDPILQEEIANAALAVLRSGHYILGPNVKAFERETATLLGIRHAIGCASGTDALLLALRAAGIGRGDEVITSTFSFAAAAEAVCHLGAIPVFVDVEEHGFNLDPERVAEALSSNTRAIVAVHLFGQTAAMEALDGIAAAHDLVLIEDCAQAFGAKRGGRCAGALSLAGCCSFYPSKNLAACGDGGMVVCDDDDLARRIRALCNHGSRQRYRYDEPGYNSRLDEIQAAILRVKLAHIGQFNQERRLIACDYDELLGDRVGIPVRDAASTHVFHQYTILTRRRDAVREALEQHGIASEVYYPLPLHRQPAFAAGSRACACPRADAISAQCLSLPIYPGLAGSAVERVAEVIAQTLQD